MAERALSNKQVSERVKTLKRRLDALVKQPGSLELLSSQGYEITPLGSGEGYRIRRTFPDRRESLQVISTPAVSGSLGYEEEARTANDAFTLRRSAAGWRAIRDALRIADDAEKICQPQGNPNQSMGS